jgi:hypothetical protein
MRTIQFLQKNGVSNLYELFHKTQDDFMQMQIVFENGLTRFLRRKELHGTLVRLMNVKTLLYQNN